jgi:hypothetical protein
MYEYLQNVDVLFIYLFDLHVHIVPDFVLRLCTGKYSSCISPNNQRGCKVSIFSFGEGGPLYVPRSELDMAIVLFSTGGTVVTCNNCTIDLGTSCFVRVISYIEKTNLERT